MKKAIPNGTTIWVSFATLHNSKYYQADLGDRPVLYSGVIFESYELADKEGFFYNVKFDFCSKFGLRADKFKKVEKQLSSKKSAKKKKI
jgi:hypothetical protein